MIRERGVHQFALIIMKRENSVYISCFLRYDQIKQYLYQLLDVHYMHNQ